MKTKIFLFSVLTVFIFACGNKSNSTDSNSVNSDNPLNNQIEQNASNEQFVFELNDTTMFFKGKINDQYAFSAYLTFDNNKISGYSYYDNVGEFIYIDGQISEDNDLIFYEKDKKGKVYGTFNGKFVSYTKIQGNWTNGQKTKKFPFYMTAQDSQFVLIKHFSKELEKKWKPNFESGLSETYEIDFVQACINPEITKFLQNSLAKFIFGTTYTQSLDKLAEESFNEDFQQFKQDCDEDEPFCNYEFDSEIDLVYDRNKLVSFAGNVYEYMGGAHGLTGFNSINFDLEKKEVVSFENLFNVDINELKPLIIKKLQEDSKESGCEPLTEFESIEVSETFIFDDGGIWIQYQQYEVYPFVCPPPTIFLSAEELKPYLKPYYYKKLTQSRY